MSKKFRPCPNCGRDISKGGHFVPPSFGQEGFFACDSFKEPPPATAIQSGEGEQFRTGVDGKSLYVAQPAPLGLDKLIEDTARRYFPGDYDDNFRLCKSALRAYEEARKVIAASQPSVAPGNELRAEAERVETMHPGVAYGLRKRADELASQPSAPVAQSETSDKIARFADQYLVCGNIVKREGYVDVELKDVLADYAATRDGV